MFISKVTGTAAALGLRVDVVGTMEQLEAEVRTNRPRAVFLDLNCTEFSPNAVVESLVGVPRPRVIAFGSHVETAKLELALHAGCDEVLPRSRFSASLPDLLQQNLGAPN